MQQRLQEPRHDALAVAEADGVDASGQERRRVRGRRVPPHQDEGVRGGTAHARDERQRVVDLERVHAGDADDLRAQPCDVPLDGAPEAQVAQLDVVALCEQRRADVLHAERFDAEEGPETEALVARHGAQQEDTHRRGRRRQSDPGPT